MVLGTDANYKFLLLILILIAMASWTIGEENAKGEIGDRISSITPSESDQRKSAPADVFTMSTNQISYKLYRRQDWITTGFDDFCDENRMNRLVDQTSPEDTLWFRLPGDDDDFDDADTDSICSNLFVYALLYDLSKEATVSCLQKVPESEFDGLFNKFFGIYDAALLAQIGGGWMREIPFYCEDGEQDVLLDILKIDNNCNWVISDTLIESGKSIDSTYVNDTIPYCGMLDFFGQTLTETGLYYHTLENSEGCDSVLVLALTVLEHPDFIALTSIYTSLGGTNWTNSDNWLSDCDPCNWWGVSCDAAGRVVGLDLASNNLSGYFSPSIGLLEFLETLDLSSNNLSGQIPSSLIDLPLSDVFLNNNALVGPYPDGLVDKCDEWVNYDLSDNDFYCPFSDYCAGLCEDCVGAECDPLVFSDFHSNSTVSRFDDGSGSGKIELTIANGRPPFVVDFNGEVTTIDTRQINFYDLSCGSYHIKVNSSHDGAVLEDINLYIPQQIMTEYAVPIDSCLELNFNPGCLRDVDMDDIACVIWSPPEAFSDPYSLNTTICGDTGNIRLHIIDNNGDIVVEKAIRLHPQFSDSNCNFAFWETIPIQLQIVIDFHFQSSFQ